jgi:hypothetical protein
MSDSVTVTSETTLQELARMLARARVRIVGFKLDAFGEYFVKAESGGQFYCGLSDQLHLAFAQIVDEIAATPNPVGRPKHRSKWVTKQTCKHCGVHAVLRRVSGDRVERRRCTVPGELYCESRRRGERSKDKQPRAPKSPPSGEEADPS